MKASKAASLSFLILLIGLGGCSSTRGSDSTSPPSLPSISISPTSVVAGSPDLKLTIRGTGLAFAGDRHFFSQAVWSAKGSHTHLATTFVSSSQLTAVIPAALLNNPVIAQVSVQTGDPMGDIPLTSYNSVSFSVTPTTSSISSISPSSDTLGPKGTRQFVYTVNGKNADATWEVEEGAFGGSITSTGLYTVPGHDGTFHVLATSVVDLSQSATATVAVVASGFTLTGGMNIPRSGHTATLLANGQVLIVGGGDGSAELFDPASRTFSLTGSPATSRFGQTSTLLANGKVLIVGGFGPGVSELPRLATAELYDPASGSFSATGAMAVGRVKHTTTLLNDSRVLVAGGTDSNGGGGAAVATAELYDPSTGRFTSTGTMSSDRANHTATLLASGEVLIVGGWNGHGADAADDPPWDPLFAELFEPSSGSFKTSGSMSTTRIEPAATRLSDGKVLMLGGIPALQNLHAQPPVPIYAELYDPATNAFSPVANIDLSQGSYTATLLTNGQVLVAGGQESNTAVASAELIDVANASVVATGSLVAARSGHTATRLKDGRVLITGGVDSSGKALASAELYK